MLTVRFSSLAKDDLLGIWRWIAQQNATMADKVFDRIEERANALALHPELGPARPEIGEGARSLLVDRWLILYRVGIDTVQIVRVVDGSRDLVCVTWGP